jgi:hypothetical protein
MKKLLQILLIILFGSNFSMAQENKQLSPAFDELQAFLNLRDLSISKDRKEIYFSNQSLNGSISVICTMKKNKSGKWNTIEIASFSGQYSDLEPFLSPDNLSLYFASNRPKTLVDTTQLNYDIWVVKRKTINEKWGSPENLGYPVNTEADEFYPSVSAKGNLVLTSNRVGSKGLDDIFYSELKNGIYSEPISLSDSINTAGYEFNAYLSEQENYLIFTGYNRKDGLGSGDLFISKKDKNGIWGLAKNLGKQINSNSMDYCPFVDEKSGILYFTSRRTSSTTKSSFTNIEELNNEIFKYENGLSRIYKVAFEVD